MNGKSIHQYEVLKKLGAGGMGIVYHARDTKLERDVALKFLPPEWSRDEDAKQRFMQEARTASGLDHQNICTIYEISETDDGQLFIVMPLYRGQTLKYKLDGHGIPAIKALDVIKQLLDGLARAHDAGIIHRDIKPANIMLTDRGQVKLLDFGIAKLGAGLGLTNAGATLGTASYMSPEQTKGGGVDKRADLWSAGVLLYEMLTGRRPFEADYEQAVIYGILNTEPEPPNKLNPGVPEQLSDAVMALLSKNPDHRPVDARAAISLIDASLIDRGVPAVEAPARGSRLLRWAIPIVGVAVVGLVTVWLLENSDLFVAEKLPGGIHSVAVIPFINLRSDPETDFLGYALADQVIGSLAYVHNLHVRPSTSIRQYENRRVDAETVGDELSVDYVVAGNYLKENDQMRLTVEMIDVRTNEIVWREPIDIQYENAFQLQDIVSEKVLHGLEVTFSEKERGRMQEGVSSNPLAYEYYLKSLSYPTTSEGNRLGLEMAERSVELDSTYAPAWNQLGFRLAQVAQFSLQGRDVAEQAARAFKKALDLNPDLLDALVNSSLSETDLGSSENGYELANRMLSINAESALGYFAKGYALRYSGMLDQSVTAMETAIRIDSTDRRFRSAGVTFYQAHDYEQAIRAFEIESGTPYSIAFISLMHLRLGRTEEARLGFEKATKLDPEGLMGLWSSAIKSSMEGDYETGSAAARITESSDIADPEAAYYTAGLYCVNHEMDGCIRSLDQAVSSGYFNYPGIMTDELMDNARDDPRYPEILERARVKHEAFKSRFFPDGSF